MSDANICMANAAESRQLISPRRNINILGTANARTLYFYFQPYIYKEIRVLIYRETSLIFLIIFIKYMNTNESSAFPLSRIFGTQIFLALFIVKISPFFLLT